MKKISLLFPLLISVLFVLTSCKKDDPPDDSQPPVSDGGVYIICEGNYQWSNGSIDYYRFADSSVTENIFESINQRPLGDVVQSMTITDGKGYIVVNNSGKVEAVNMDGFTSAGSITGLISPRYLLPVGNHRAYVSDLYSNSISIVDLNTMQKTGSINLHGSSEEMILWDDNVFVTNTRTSYVYLVDLSSDLVTDSIAVGFASNSIRLDKDNKIWVSCAGDATLSINASLYKIDPATRLVVTSFDLGSPLNIWDKMTINGSKDIIYYLNNGLWKLNINATTLETTPLIARDGRTLQGLGVDPDNGVIWLSDAKDYVQKGMVFRYHADGNLISSFSTGIIPSGFYFYHPQ
jgi:hypothetical protein